MAACSLLFLSFGKFAFLSGFFSPAKLSGSVLLFVFLEYGRKCLTTNPRWYEPKSISLIIAPVVAMTLSSKLLDLRATIMMIISGSDPTTTAGSPPRGAAAAGQQRSALDFNFGSFTC